MLITKNQQTTMADLVVARPSLMPSRPMPLFQVEDITQDQAKQRYIDLANNYLLYRK